VIFLTYNDQPSGIYNSQVIDVINYLNAIQDTGKVQLVALISIRSYFRNKKLIRQRLPESIVVPMIPKVALWRLNYFLLSFIIKDKTIMARGPFAASLALRLKRSGKIDKVIFDARGAYKAELNEYDVVPNEKIKREIASIEKDVVLNSDFCLAVSQALVNYWKKEFNYGSYKHIVVPCTLSKDLQFDFPTREKISEIKNQIGFSEKDIVIVYSGSSAGWQSFSLIEKILSDIFEKNSDVKLLWLTNHVPQNSSFINQFKNRIKTAWVKPEDVKNYLLAGDHGFLYREDSVTNQVASPVKFAEYLSCGLNVLISQHLGDFSDFVAKNNCGNVGKINSVAKVSYEQKQKNHELAMKYMLKEDYRTEYLKLMQD
jgi:hypothetical protein